MKVRIQNNTLRVRLNEREVNQLQEGGELTSVTSFPENELVISLKADNGNSAKLSSSQIILRVAQERVNHWASSEDVSIAMEFTAANDEKLSILVEKDMKI